MSLSAPRHTHLPLAPLSPTPSHLYRSQAHAKLRIPKFPFCKAKPLFLPSLPPGRELLGLLMGGIRWFDARFNYYDIHRDPREWMALVMAWAFMNECRGCQQSPQMLLIILHAFSCNRSTAASVLSTGCKTGRKSHITCMIFHTRVHTYVEPGVKSAINNCTSKLALFPAQTNPNKEFPTRPHTTFFTVMPFRVLFPPWGLAVHPKLGGCMGVSECHLSQWVLRPLFFHKCVLPASA